MPAADLATETDGRGRAGCTYRAQGAEDAIVEDEIGLLGEARQVLGLGDAPAPSQRREEVLHGAGAQAGEEDDEEGDEAQVGGAGGISAARGLEVGQREEGCGIGARRGQADVGREEQADEVEAEFC